MWQRILLEPKDNHLISDLMIAVTNVVVRVLTVLVDDLVLLSAVGSAAI